MPWHSVPLLVFIDIQITSNNQQEYIVKTKQPNHATSQFYIHNLISSIRLILNIRGFTPSRLPAKDFYIFLNFPIFRRYDTYSIFLVYLYDFASSLEIKKASKS
ncbi:hypothetical protein HMPREF1207_02173 [Paenibacillus sp. HGH0039]|nr:hypothetical protein HMPREF1207_02173 [Paenibacillus sp. HGH0039]